MKKFIKYLLGTVSLCALGYGIYYFFKNYILNADESDDSDDDFEDEDEDEIANSAEREYVSINITPDTDTDADTETDMADEATAE